jgi:hypothetical protein
MRYIVLEKSSFNALDPIHANPFAGAWCLWDNFNGEIRTTFKTKAKAEATAQEWNDDPEEEVEGY